MNDKNSKPQGIVRIIQEEFRDITTSTATFSINSDKFTPEIRSNINLRSFLRQKIYSNNFHPWF